MQGVFSLKINRIVKVQKLKLLWVKLIKTSLIKIIKVNKSIFCVKAKYTVYNLKRTTVYALQIFKATGHKKYNGFP